MSANPAEIAKFTPWAQDWWNPEGPMKPLHQINPLRLQVIKNTVDLSGKQVLDVGCGGGLLSEALASCQAQVTGIDLNESLIETAKRHAQQHGLAIDYQLISSTQLLAKQSGCFDVITCMELLEHVPDPAEIIKECALLAKPGGMLFFATLNRNIQSFIKAILAAEYLLKLLPKGTHQYGQFLRPSEITLWAAQNGLQFKGLQGMTYNPFTGQFSLSKDVSVNYMLVFIRGSGKIETRR
ncbi:MAG: bifunctional 2-polyprenyl-6-hydroxyphenol methylase/3-demethylubiquinol 3-O-methyltransferase UbiG [Proteobacteria bacterium]|nr:bifunctional 2-polyprenyl-6-hydroxyphenol methylase/3-demethylubiquinol 3-O-methyltransferase UbiG [Pseudomonadota bacterium]